MTTAITAARPSFWARAGSWALRALRLELGIYAGIGRAIVRRPAIPAGGAWFSYHRPILTILVIFIVLSAVEIPIFDLIVHRWPVVRIVVLILGIWGLTWMVGYLCAMLMRPHVVGSDGIRARSGIEIDIPLPWDDIAWVEIARRVDEEKAPRIIDQEGRATLALRIGNSTNILILLERPSTVRLPGLAPKGGEHSVQGVRLWADDPKAFLRAVGTHI